MLSNSRYLGSATTLNSTIGLIRCGFPCFSSVNQIPILDVSCHSHWGNSRKDKFMCHLHRWSFKYQPMANCTQLQVNLGVSLDCDCVELICFPDTLYIWLCDLEPEQDLMATLTCLELVSSTTRGTSSHECTWTKLNPWRIDKAKTQCRMKANAKHSSKRLIYFQSRFGKDKPYPGQHNSTEGGDLHIVQFALGEQLKPTSTSKGCICLSA